MYRVVTFFYDLQDDFHAYQPGDKFPRQGVKADPERIAYLAGGGNRLGIPVIEEVKEKPKRSKETEE